MIRRVLPSILLVLASACMFLTCSQKKPDQVTIIDEHPRMFFNQKTWPKVKQYTLEHEKEEYEKLKARVASLPDTADRKLFLKGSNPLFGPNAQRAAFVWLMEGDSTALAKARNYLFEGLKWYYEMLEEKKKDVHWYSCSRVCALTAYDWIYHELTPQERHKFGKGMLEHYTKSMDGRELKRINKSGVSSGFYGITNMPWYLALAFHGEGIDDELCEKFMHAGYARHIELLKYRARGASDDGGTGSQSLGYGLGFYPFSEYNFMHTALSAAGIDLAAEYPHLSLLANWAYWNLIPPDKCYGLADAHHTSNGFSDTFLPIHFQQAAHFWAKKYPDRARFAAWMRQDVIQNKELDTYWFPCTPFYLYNCGTLPEPKGVDDTWPLARHFPVMGQTFMRSGFTANDVHAVFISGGTMNGHRHFDQGHFMLYKKGFLTLDTGTYGDRNSSGHNLEYQRRTVAHNCILIHTAEDSLPKTWGARVATADGGQVSHNGKTVAFETNEHYTYTAGDLTGAYWAGKARQVVRQFVHVQPDVFVIFDRVETVNPTDLKSFVIHTARKPMLSGNTFSADQNEGRMFCRTLLPEDAKFELVGGPGKEYWSAGKNWEPQGPVGQSELQGRWRVEVSPGARAAYDVFLHVFKVGEKKTLTGLGPMETVKADGKCGVRFKSGDTSIEVLFNTEGDIGGHIIIAGKVDQDLATDVLPQSGLTGSGEAM